MDSAGGTDITQSVGAAFIRSFPDGVVLVASKDRLKELNSELLKILSPLATRLVRTDSSASGDADNDRLLGLIAELERRYLAFAKTVHDEEAHDELSQTGFLRAGPHASANFLLAQDDLFKDEHDSKVLFRPKSGDPNQAPVAWCAPDTRSSIPPDTHSYIINDLPAPTQKLKRAASLSKGKAKKRKMYVPS